jgi:hypothetical protein
MANSQKLADMLKEENFEYLRPPIDLYGTLQWAAAVEIQEVGEKYGQEALTVIEAAWQATEDESPARFPKSPRAQPPSKTNPWPAGAGITRHFFLRKSNVRAPCNHGSTVYVVASQELLLTKDVLFPQVRNLEVLRNGYSTGQYPRDQRGCTHTC